MLPHVVYYIKTILLHGQIQILSTVHDIMNRAPSVEDVFYCFSDEEGGDALLPRAFARWEQLGCGSTRGQLFKFIMQPTFPMQPTFRLSVTSWVEHT